jgi:tetratricopeptide (TPR) repeat protein
LRVLLEEGKGIADKDRSLIASLRLSLQRLEEEARSWVPRLGVFRSGAWEPQILRVTEVEEATWQTVRQQLAAAGLIQAEMLPNVTVPYLKFHPTLAPALWSELLPEMQQELLTRHHRTYYELSVGLYQLDQQSPNAARSIVLRELPNLLFAVRGAIAAEEEWAIDFVDNVNLFLGFFGMNRDRADLSQLASALEVAIGSQSWYLARSVEAEQLFNVGRAAAAAQKFATILEGLGSQPSYDRCLTLSRLGRCLKAQSQLGAAAECYRSALAEAAQLEASDGMKRQQGGLQADLADVLMGMGDYAGAKAAYEASLEIAQEQEDARQVGVIKGQLGTLALMQGNLPEAEQRYQDALATFQGLHEPASEAVFWHQLGVVYRRAQQWQAAEQAYRRSAELKEGLGDRLGAAQTWGNLAIVTQRSGNPQDAEAWYRKALATRRAEGDLAGASLVLSNLANLLCQQPDRLPEARQLAEDSLEIKQTLDPAAAELWKTYGILATISEAQQRPDDAQAYRRLARQSKAAFAGTRHELQKFAPLIAAVVAATTDPAGQQELAPALEDGEQQGYQNLVAAIRRILAGERQEEALCAALDLEDSMVVMAILAGIADPATLAALG